MKKWFLYSLVGFLLSCSGEDATKPYPCIDGNCDVNFYIDSSTLSDLYQDNNGYWHLEHGGPNYFNIIGELDELNNDYVVNGVPLIEVTYDSDYWVWIDGLTFTVPLYNVLGYFTGGGYVNPIPVGNLTYTIEDMADIHPPLNIVGYQINKHQCMDCPYSPTLIGVYSKYNYRPRQQVFFDSQMKGDTAKILIKTVFNSDFVPSEEVTTQFDIIFE